MNCNWAIVSDITLYIVIPIRRSFASASQILVSHAFGDAVSPYLIGVIADAVKSAISHNHHPMVLSEASSNETTIATHKIVEVSRVSLIFTGKCLKR